MLATQWSSWPCAGLSRSNAATWKKSGPRNIFRARIRIRLLFDHVGVSKLGLFFPGLNSSSVTGKSEDDKSNSIQISMAWSNFLCCSSRPMMWQTSETSLVQLRAAESNWSEASRRWLAIDSDVKFIVWCDFHWKEVVGVVVVAMDATTCASRTSRVRSFIVVAAYDRKMNSAEEICLTRKNMAIMKQVNSTQGRPCLGDKSDDVPLCNSERDSKAAA